MSPTAIGLVFILIVSRQNVDGNDKDGKISNTDIDNIMVSFWEYRMPPTPSKLICLGIFIRSNWIFLTTHCAEKVKRIGTNTTIEYGGYAAKETLPEFINMDCIKEVHPLSRFSIVFLRDNHLLPSSLKLDCVNPYLQGSNPINGKLVGWDQKLGRPETENVKFYTYPLIQLHDKIKPCGIPIFPEGSILVEDRNIIALANDIKNEKNMFTQISFADKLLIEDLLETEDESNGEGTPKVGRDENVNIRKIDFYNIIVSFWRPQKKSHSLELICLGILIRSNWILLTTKCADKLEPFSDTVIKYGIYAIHNILPEESKIVDKTLLLSNSGFSIVLVNSNILLQSSLKLDYAKPHPKSEPFDGTLVGWSKRAERPDIIGARIIVHNQITLKSGSRKSTRWIIPEGSILVIDRRIIAFANDKRRGVATFNKIPFDVKLKVETMLEIEDERTSKVENVQISQKDYENVIVIFFKKTDTEQRNILCLGLLVRPDWAFVTIQGFEKLKPFSETTAVIGKNPLKSNLLGVQKLRRESYFIIIALDSHTEATSSLKFFTGDHLQGGRVGGKFVGWNSKGLTKSNEVFTFQHHIKFRDEESVKARLSNFSEGSLLIKGRNVVALSYLDDAVINFYKITFRDYVNVQGLIQGVTPTQIDSENFLSKIMSSEKKPTFDPPCKKGRMSSEMERVFVAADLN